MSKKSQSKDNSQIDVGTQVVLRELKNKSIKKQALKKVQLRDMIRKKMVSKLLSKQVSSYSDQSSQKTCFQAPKKLNTKNFFNLLDQDRWTCALCIQIYVHPVLLQCGHVFCLYCLEASGIHSGPGCPLCRAKFLHFRYYPYPALQQWIKKKVNIQRDEWLEFSIRNSAFEMWKKNRELNRWGVEEGEYLDYYTCYGWRRVRVQRQFYRNNKLCFQVSYEGNQEEIGMMISCSSKFKGLAPPGFYTRGKYSTIHEWIYKKLKNVIQNIVDKKGEEFESEEQEEESEEEIQSKSSEDNYQNRYVNQLSIPLVQDIIPTFQSIQNQIPQSFYPLDEQISNSFEFNLE